MGLLINLALVTVVKLLEIMKCKCASRTCRGPWNWTFVKKNGCGKIMENISCVDLDALQLAVQMWGTVESYAEGQQDRGAGLALPVPLGISPYLAPEGFPPEFFRWRNRGLESLEARPGSEAQQGLEPGQLDLDFRLITCCPQGDTWAALSTCVLVGTSASHCTSLLTTPLLAAPSHLNQQMWIIECLRVPGPMPGIEVTHSWSWHLSSQQITTRWIGSYQLWEGLWGQSRAWQEAVKWWW